MIRLKEDFFQRDVLLVAPELPGKLLVVGNRSAVITEVEAYRGEEDLACHASKGRTSRTEIMYHEGGHVYIYLIYGMYWMLNFVTEQSGNPQAVLIRGIEGYEGPGKLTRYLAIDRSFYGENLCTSQRICVTDTGIQPDIKTRTRIGIEYAGKPWTEKPWRYLLYKGK